MTSKIEFNSHKQPGDGWCMMVADPPSDLRAAGDLVTSLENLEIEFSYCVGTSVVKPYNSPGGFTRLKLFECIQEGYREIYEAPDAYEVWGHDFGHLFLEGAALDGNLLTLEIGS